MCFLVELYFLILLLFLVKLYMKRPLMCNFYVCNFLKALRLKIFFNLEIIPKTLAMKLFDDIPVNLWA